MQEDIGSRVPHIHEVHLYQNVDKLREQGESQRHSELYKFHCGNKQKQTATLADDGPVSAYDGIHEGMTKEVFYTEDTYPALYASAKRKRVNQIKYRWRCCG